MADYTFPPGVVLVEATGNLAVGATGVLRPTAGAAAVQVFDLNDSAIPNVVVGPKGAHASFKADIAHGVLDFGSVVLPVISLEAQAAALEAQFAAESAAASAQAAQIAAEGKADANHTHSGTGGTGGSNIKIDGVTVAELDIRSDLALLAPAVVVPPASTFSTPGMATWPSANYANFMRFTQVAERAYRYINFGMDTPTGSIEAGIVRLSGADLRTFTKVASTGVIAAPAPPGTGVWQHLDLGSNVNLTPGEYALFLWANNTTVRSFITGTGSIQASRLTADNSFTGGVPASGSMPAWGGYRYVGGMTLEAAS